ncbi:OLC1v1016995C1 [Oldenlandia corymbosa var. corymbosa]|uniref:OLC1v1016995C1 n=1 Tax=Oldenlandia corymbosa var. corymbosa TaxID=529605 RepID=A0AAV1E8G9_OLDCO|nr:OLC1v1016995C1 [Oldenlandia corymbosa var. corymbosa]
MSKAETEDRRNKDDLNPIPPPWPPRGPDRAQTDKKLLGILLFGVVGAMATVAAVAQLRNSVDWVYSQLSRSKASWKSSSNGSFRTSFQEEAWKRYNRRMQEEYEEEMARVERIRRMQSVFNRERSKYKRSYERWAQNDDGTYHQHFQRNDWYWKGDTSFRDQGDNFREASRPPRNYPLSHHYSVLGLERSRTKPYTDEEIKSAFRAKALQFHPDQNQNNKGANSHYHQIVTSNF